MLSEELVAAFLIGFALGVSIRNEQLNKATEQRDRAAESYKDRFGKCIGEKCMAYENGRCKRLEREGTQ